MTTDKSILASGYYFARTKKLPITLGDGDTVTIGISLDDAETQLKNISPSELYAFAYIKNTEGDIFKTSHLPEIMTVRKIARQSCRFKKRK